jgi:uroporphyrinogen decarboxylase
VIVKDDITLNEFGMHMKPASLYVEVVRSPSENAELSSDIEDYSFTNAWAPGRFNKAKRDMIETASEFGLY